MEDRRVDECYLVGLSETTIQCTLWKDLTLVAYPIQIAQELNPIGSVMERVISENDDVKIWWGWIVFFMVA